MEFQLKAAGSNFLHTMRIEYFYNAFMIGLNLILMIIQFTVSDLYDLAWINRNLFGISILNIFNVLLRLCCDASTESDDKQDNNEDGETTKLMHSMNLAIQDKKKK